MHPWWSGRCQSSSCDKRCNACRRNWITGLTSAASPRVHISSTCTVGQKLGQILYLLICSFLPCLSWLLRSRVRKCRRDLRITLYMMGLPLWQGVGHVLCQMSQSYKLHLNFVCIQITIYITFKVLHACSLLVYVTPTIVHVYSRHTYTFYNTKASAPKPLKFSTRQFQWNLPTHGKFN